MVERGKCEIFVVRLSSKYINNVPFFCFFFSEIW